ncbi:SusC/RagA family TonB-linked outer membrane protein [Flavivirga algicola]|uniref:SusC/RagA family TonB-linked outer membrane protein n=1 Tax=Flavivirga algicola TaxID=2729136 RepID=A0ABX1S1I6_9FLAO|nr:SusC/RagA family TonB-linked outer membrane protein [Flavivirga algicola]NMH89702.1 SusC/RagA family TonB-linked outer membrane protein [Flavivirga algicola]
MNKLKDLMNLMLHKSEEIKFAGVFCYIKKGLERLIIESFIRLFCMILFCFISTYIVSQNKTFFIKEMPELKISGTVKDQSGLPIPHATVLIKDTGSGKPTNLDGQYTIKVSETSQVLVFSSIGFETQEIMVGNQTTINIVLKEGVDQLDEITIEAGYYKTSQRLATGSISKLEAKTIEKQTVNNPLAAIQGHLPGVNITQNTGVPGSGYQIRIRGQNFIGPGGPLDEVNDPLYIIDGVPYNSGSLELSSLTGNIIPGGKVSPLNTINPADIKSIEVLKDADATAIYGARGANGVILITTKKDRIGKTQVKLHVSSTLSEVPRFVDVLNAKQYLEMRKEAIENEGFTLQTIPASSRSAFPDLYVWDQERNTDWQEVLIGGTAYRQRAQLSFSGSDAQTQFLLSGGYVTETTVFIGDSKYDKASLLVNVNHQSEDRRFKLRFSGNYGSDTNNLPPQDFTKSALILPPNAPALYNATGNLNWENSTWRNPLSMLEQDYQARTHNLIANTVWSYHPIPSLEFKTSLGYTDYRLQSYAAFPHTSFDPNSASGQDSSRSSISTNSSKRESWIVEPQINWNYHLGNINLKLLLGTTFQQEKDQQLGLSASNFPSNALLQNLAAAKDKRVILDTDTEYKYQAFFGRINFNWKDRLILNITGRRDGSSRFGPGKQFGKFGAIGTAWLFSEERFFENHAVLSFGKLRASYGITGSDKPPDYAFLDTYEVSGNYNGSGLAPTRLFNPNRAWEENKKLETALELGFFKDRVFLSAVWYRNRSSNQLLSVPLPGTTGFSSINANLDAIIENKGVEIDLRTVNIQNDSFKWRTTFNISTNRNKLVAFPELEKSTLASEYLVEKPLGIWQLYHVLGVDPETGVWQFEDYNDDGVINKDDRQWLEDLTPKYFGGMGHTITYKNMQLDMFFQFVKQKGRSFIQSGVLNLGGMAQNMPVSIWDRWQQVGDENSIQRFFLPINNTAAIASNTYRHSNASVTDASFIRLRNASLSYTMPKAITKHMDINIYLQGQNLFIITRYDGADPEVQSASVLPPLRQFTLGFNVTF